MKTISIPFLVLVSLSQMSVISCKQFAFFGGGCKSGFTFVIVV